MLCTKQKTTVTFAKEEEKKKISHVTNSYDEQCEKVELKVFYYLIPIKKLRHVVFYQDNRESRGGQNGKRFQPGHQGLKMFATKLRKTQVHTHKHAFIYTNSNIHTYTNIYIKTQIQT